MFEAFALHRDPNSAGILQHCICLCRRLALIFQTHSDFPDLFFGSSGSVIHRTGRILDVIVEPNGYLYVGVLRGPNKQVGLHRMIYSCFAMDAAQLSR